MKHVCSILAAAAFIASATPVHAEDLSDCMVALRAKEAGDVAGALMKFKSCFLNGDLTDYSKVVTLRQVGFMYRDSGNIPKAIEYYEKAMRFHPADPWADYVNRGNAYTQIGKFDLAFADYDSAMRLKPNYDEAYYNRGVAFEEMKQPAKAKIEFVAAYNAGMRTKYLRDRLMAYGLISK